MKITIERSEPTTGSQNRTDREEMHPLFNGPDGDQTEPEQYVDVSPSQAFAWRFNPKMCTWLVQMPSVKGITAPFAAMDSQAAAEAARAGGSLVTSAGGVATYPFSDRYLPLSDQRDDEGDLIIDLNPDNFDERWAHFLSMYPDHFENGRPRWGATVIMSAVVAGDDHYMDEFGKLPRDKRPVRARIAHSDGLLNDEKAFRTYLAQAVPVDNPDVSTVTPLGRHGEWDEAWIAAIYGEEGGDGHKAYEQYVELAADHPWIHPVYFADVMNGDEAAEDIAYLAVPAGA